MQHNIQDSYDAGARNRRHEARAASKAEWHPILAAVEHEPGVWHLHGQYRPYAVIRLLRVGGEPGYRATTWEEQGAERRLIGYYTTLRAACWYAHRHFLAQQARAGGVNGR